MKLPTLQETKFNKRVNKFTPVIRVYTTKKKGTMYFMDIDGQYKYCAAPYFFWTPCAFAYPSLQAFYARICGVN